MSTALLPSPRLAPALLLALAAAALTTPATAQNGYSVQGNYNPGSAYRQQGAPPAGAGLSTGPSYIVTPTPRRSVSPPAYQQQAPLYQPYAYPPGTVQAPVYNPSSSKKKVTSKPTTDYSSGSSITQLRRDISDLEHNDRQQDRRIAALENKLGTSHGDDYSSRSNVIYTVKYGDTLSRIADRYNTTPDKIIAANGLRSDIIIEGDSLTIPGTRRNGYTPPKPKNTNSGGIYIVQHGDTLSDIAAAHHVSLASLQSHNGIRNAHTIIPGQRISIPGNSLSYSPRSKTKRTTTPKAPSLPRYVSTPKPSTQLVSFPAAGAGVNTAPLDGVGAIPEPTGPRGITSYRIETGDTLDTIAQSFGTTATEIRSLNQLTGSGTPSVGSEIIVPSVGPMSL